MAKGNETKKMLFGSVAAIASITLVFGGISQVVKAAELGKTQSVPTSYSVPYTETINSKVPADYVKKDYEVKFAGPDKPSVNDMKMEEAAELASQNLWRIFQVDLDGRTLEMTYYPISTTQLRAIWEANVKINDSLAYSYSLDAVTGESHAIAKWVYHNADIPEGMDANLLKNNEAYQALAKEAAEKYQVVSGKVTSVEYSSQGFQENKAGARNADIAFKVKSDSGETAQLSFSRYNQELLTIEYSSWVEETERREKQIEQELKERASDVTITEEMLKKVGKNGELPFLIELK